MISRLQDQNIKSRGESPYRRIILESYPSDQPHLLLLSEIR
jgi:hypothetical protein